MKKILPVLMGVGLLLLSSTEGWSLPPCPGSPTDDYDNTAKSWTDCFGNFNWSNKAKYVGEWKDGEFPGKGIFSAFLGAKVVVARKKN